ncbi:MAG TPA: hypothetical protein VNL77_16850 [Roseiflexaceae bacterium]|nr:hypothetical protein [Roseiflexaceae bacterium]
MKVIRYRIYLEQPVLATQILGDPNSSVSFSYIPGSQLRGMLIHRFCERSRRLREDAVAQDPQCRRLFFSGQTRYLHAYPLVEESGLRSLPTPRAFFRRKGGKDNTVYNAAHKDFDRRAAEGDDTLKPITVPFCRIENDSLALYEPKPNRLAVHIARERAKGRATEGGGAIFQYDALAPDQWFGGVVLIDNDDDAETLRALLPGPAWLGRSRSAGYGKVRIELEPDPSGPWREVGGAYPTLPVEQPATITLLSDTVLRDERGNPALTIDAATLGTYLGTPVTAIDDVHSFSAALPQGGFNRTWKLPLPQAYALAAGSTITFTPQKTLDVAAVRRIEEQGIGERRAEGFGRVAFGWLTEETLSAREGELYRVREQAPDLTPASRAMLQQMARRLLELRIEEQIARFVRDQVIPHAGQMPANSQLGRVRVLLRRAMREGYNFAAVRQGLNSFKAAGRRQFERARITNTTLWTWLEGLLADPPARDVWEVIGLQQSSWPPIAGERAAPDPALTRVVTIRLIDAVLTGASRERKRMEDAR